jgi:purine-cytosine permease-like protein
VYLGFLIPSTPLLILGAAIGGAIPNVESWQTAWNDYGIGGVMAEMLKPAGGFGRFVLVVLALSIVGNMLLSYYSVALCLQMLVPVFTKVPRFVFVIVTLAIMVPMSIYAAAQWEKSLVNFLSMIGYWAGCFDAVIIEELVVFRNRDYGLIDPKSWNQGRKLPTGLAAIGASIISLGLVIPSMNTPWFTGPIGARIGDVGFEAAFVVTGIAYYPLRALEIKLMGRVWYTHIRMANTGCWHGLKIKRDSWVSAYFTIVNKTRNDTVVIYGDNERSDTERENMLRNVRVRTR